MLQLAAYTSQRAMLRRATSQRAEPGLTDAPGFAPAIPAAQLPLLLRLRGALPRRARDPQQL